MDDDWRPLGGKMPNPVSNVYSLEEMLSLIQREQPFAGELESAGCFIKIEDYLLWFVLLSMQEAVYAKICSNSAN